MEVSLSNSEVSRRAGLFGKENRGVGAVVALVGGSTAGVGATRKLGFGGGGGGGGAVADSAIALSWLLGSLYSLLSTLSLPSCLYIIQSSLRAKQAFVWPPI